MLPLTEKYKPQTLRAVIGQQGEMSNLYKLKLWLENWHKNQDPKVKKTLIRPSPWAKKDDGAYFKCALLSGPPGVGKTTSATLVAKELGLDIVEFNASDTRSKKLLHEEVSQLLSSKTIAGYATGKKMNIF
jgi:replication factor C subunit 1